MPALAGRLHVRLTRQLDAAAYAQPIIAAGRVVVATENNTVYAFSAVGVRPAWHRHLATPARRADLPCGNLDPSGVTGTPAYDATTRTVFVATEDGDAHHTLYALDVATGGIRWHRDLDVVAGRDRHAEQQRGALLVTAGRAYVAFGGRAGDCGNYVGYVAAVATDGAGATLHYAVPTQREAGMWAPPGPVVGPGGDLYVATGNGAEVGGHYDDSDSVLRLSPTLQPKALFAPSTWRQDNVDDLDLGSMAPAIVGDDIVIAGKRSIVYLLSPSLGGIGGQRASLSGCAGFGGAAVRGDVVVLPCDDGLRALRVGNGSMRWVWRRSDVHGSPVLAGDAVYGVEGPDLVELAIADGHVRARVRVGDATRFTTPVPSIAGVFVATTSRLVLVTDG